MEKEIKLGLPKGSLNTPSRGNTQQVLIDAGYDIRGYEPGKESDRNLAITNDPEIIPFLTRPQSAPVELSIGFLDIAINGEDWIQEETISNEQNGIRKIGDLGYGQTRIVAAIPASTSYESLADFFRSQRGGQRPILCFTEYVNLTRQAFMQNVAYQEIFGGQSPLVQIRGLVSGTNRMVQILNSDGVTEGYITKGADIIIDNTQSGSTLKEYGLRELEQIMESSVGLYAGPTCTGWKEKKAQYIFRMFQSAVPKNLCDMKFNVPRANLEKLKRYLISEGLSANRPTVIEEADNPFGVVNIIIPRKDFPNLVETLIGDYGASAIVRNEIKQYIE